MSITSKINLNNIKQIFHPSKAQLEDAAEIIRVCNRADSRFITLENGMDDLKSCICESIVMTDDDTQKELDNVDTELIKYENKLADVRNQNHHKQSKCHFQHFQHYIQTPTRPQTNLPC